VKQVFARDCGLVARVMPRADPDHAAAWNDALAAAGFVCHAPTADPERYCVDLKLSESEQRASLGAKWRANLQKALAQPLDCREADLDEALPDFIGLYQTMLARKHFVDHHNIKLLPAFAAAAARRPELGVRLFLACHDGQPVAGSIVVGNGDLPFVAFSASDDRARALRAGYSLRWWIINRLRGSNARWLDLGGSEGDPGLRSFKLGNVGKRGRVVQIAGDYDCADNSASIFITEVMSTTRKWLRDGPLQKFLARGPA
jgi:vancomycin resistance protein VanK